MEKNVKIFILLFTLPIIFIAISAKCVSAEDINVTATVDQNLATMSDKIRLTLTVHGTQETSPPSFPDISTLELLYGPKISAQTRIVNGVVSTSKSYIYVLQPTSPGKFTIGPSTLKYKGKVYTSDPIYGEVNESSPSRGSQTTDLEKLIFVEMSVENKEPYIYEQVLLSFKLYFQKGLPISDIDYQAPATKNFLTEQLGSQRQYEEIRDGIIYSVLELRTALFPISTGELMVSPAKLNCNLTIRSKKNRRNSNRDNFFSDSFFDDFFGIEQKRYPVERKTNSITLHVKPLPEQGKPEEFNGAVGHFDMQASVKTKNVKVGDPITLSISVYGEGNIQTISEPVLRFSDKNDFKIYPAESSTQITNKEETIRGRKVFSKVIEPQNTAVKYTPSIVFSFFEPGTGMYKTIIKEPVPIVVESWDQEVPIQLSASQDMTAREKQQAHILTQDILPIMTNFSSFRNHDNRIYRNPIILACIFIPVATLIVSGFIAKHKERLQTDVGYARNRRAHSRANKRLLQAKNALAHNTPEEFYTLLSRVMADYLADKFNISAASASAETIGTLLKQQKIEKKINEELISCIENFDYRRFSKDWGTKEEMRQSLETVEQLITKLEKQL